MEKETSSKCRTHGYELEFYCVQCKVKICKACVTLQTKQKHECMFFTDYVTEILGGKIDKLSGTLKESGDVIAKHTTVFIQELPALKKELFGFKKRLEELSKEASVLIDLLGEAKEPGAEKEIIKEGIVKLKAMKIELGDVKVGNISGLEKELDELEKLFLFLLNLKDSFAALKGEFQTLKKQIEATTPLSSLINIAKSLSIAMKETWTLDSNFMHHNLQLSNNNMTVEKVYESSNVGAIGTKGFSSGIHRWEVKIDNVDKYDNNTGYWTCFGVIQKEKFTKGSDHGSSFSIVTYNSYYGVTGQYKPYIREGQVFSITLNCDEGTMKIEGDEIDMKAIGLKGLVLYPFFQLYFPGNKLTIRIP